MLRILDLVIGFAAVMLTMSIAVAFITQAVVAVANLRGRHLRSSIAMLLREALPGAPPRAMAEIATLILRHPLLADPMRRLGGVIERDELIRVVLEIASGRPTQDDNTAERYPAVRELRSLLAQAGIPDPDMVLKQIETYTIRAAADGKTGSAHQGDVIVAAAASDFVARLYAWFDPTMARTTDRFVFTTRAVTFGTAVLLASLLQFDGIALINRLTMGDEERQRAIEVLLASPAVAATDDVPTRDDLARSALSRMSVLSNMTGLITVPAPGTWMRNWQAAKIPGIMLSAIFLTLGAPLCFRMLRDILALRPVLAGKEEGDRQERSGVT